MSTLLLQAEGQRLKTFRLSDLPKSIRLEAAMRLSRRMPKEIEKLEIELMRSVTESERYALLDECVELTQKALFPRSRRMYQVEVAEWEAMLVKAEALDERAKPDTWTLPAGATEMIEVA